MKFLHKLFRAITLSINLTVAIAVGIVAGILWNLGTTANTVAIVLIIVMAAYTVVLSVIEMIQSIRQGHVGLDILAVLSIVSTVAVQQFWAAWVVVLMVHSGSAIEAYARRRAQNNLSALVDAAPRTAHIVTNTEKLRGLNASTVRKFSQEAIAEAAQEFNTVPVEQIDVNEFIIVKPGETVPTDGILVSHSATLDLSMINGEPMPATVNAGTKILSGAINGDAILMMQVTTLPSDSQYQRILDLVRSAEESRAPVLKVADRLAIPFTIISLIIAGLAWGLTGLPIRFAEVLVLATPCPLLIAAPVAFMGGTGRLAHHGIIIKGQEIIEQLQHVTHVFFDKTGTLTKKKPEVVALELAPSWNPTGKLDLEKVDTETLSLSQSFGNAGGADDNAVGTTGVTGTTIADWVLDAAGAVESYSLHVLAKGISAAASQDGSLVDSVRGVEEHSGQGMIGYIDNHKVMVGRLDFVSNLEEAPFPPASADQMVTYVSIDDELAARIVLRDLPRENAAESVSRLRSLGINAITMLTGDRPESAHIIGQEVGITDVRASLLPQDKFNAVTAAHIQSSGIGGGTSRAFAATSPMITMMVGDGVNDAPVLAAADVGIAMTDGSSTAASESAQAVIMTDNIAAVPMAVEIAKRTGRIMLQAVIGGLAIAIVLMIFAAFGVIPAVVGAFLQEAIDVVSILWALTAAFETRKSRSQLRSQLPTRSQGSPLQPQAQSQS
jgi:cation transport ATPase